MTRIGNGHIGLGLRIRRQAHALGDNVLHQTVVGALQQLHLGVNLSLGGQTAVNHRLGLGTGGLQHSQGILRVYIMAL